MITHRIYEIPGRKIGCTKRSLKSRQKNYTIEKNGKITLILIEELSDMSDQEAGDREWWWADKLGYKRGPHYTHTVNAAVGAITAEMRKEISRKGGIAGGAIGAKNRVANQTPEERSEISRRAGLIGGKRTAMLGKSGFKTMPSEKRGCAKRGTCPHCGYESNIPTLYRLHFDRCPKISKSSL
jgi:hypothetical protein